MIIIYAQPIRNAVQHFSREVVPMQAEPPPWKSGQPGTAYEKKTALSGGKTKKKLPSVFLRLRDTHKKYILQKKSVKTAIRAIRAVVRAIYRRLYGVATANWMINISSGWAINYVFPLPRGLGCPVQL